ncbi:transposase [Alteromonas sp. LMIT006]|jgi:transposase-like protein|uniref:transposase n=1 Tax=Alteromonadaceae TaxID=72275 RepID=UPI0020CA9B81|nr:transposase [Alteromonas sp. LMIT006]UTP72652.1 transposase [Alteromonas sp. LMIT006]
MSGIKQTTSRRVFSPEYKMHIVNEVTQGTLSVSVISRQFDINHNQIFRWVREARDGKASWVTKAKQTTELVAPESAVSESLLPVTVVSEPVKPSVPPPPTAASMHIELRNGHRIVFHDNHPGFIKTVIEALT